MLDYTGDKPYDLYKLSLCAGAIDNMHLHISNRVLTEGLPKKGSRHGGWENASPNDNLNQSILYSWCTFRNQYRTTMEKYQYLLGPILKCKQAGEGFQKRWMLEKQDLAPYVKRYLVLKTILKWPLTRVAGQPPWRLTVCFFRCAAGLNIFPQSSQIKSKL